MNYSGHHRLTSGAKCADTLESNGAEIFTTGVFDILHRGHLNILTQAAALGELIVGIMTDQGVEDTKGSRPSSPSRNVTRRSALCRSCQRSSTTRTSISAATTPRSSPISSCRVTTGCFPRIAARRRSSFCATTASAWCCCRAREGISSTEIRRRVARSGRRDEQFLRDRLRMVPLDDAAPLRGARRGQGGATGREDAGRTRVLQSGCRSCASCIVIDGANRLEALKRLGAKARALRASTTTRMSICWAMCSSSTTA